MVKITLHNSQKDLPFSTVQMKRAVAFLLKELKVSTQEVIVHFVSTARISRLHKDFFNDATVTDCITFPMDAPDVKSHNDAHLLGEAFICPQIAKEYAAARQKDPYEELLRYLIHCLLHLIGYEDIQPGAKQKMKRKENFYLKKLTAAGFLKKL